MSHVGRDAESGAAIENQARWGRFAARNPIKNQDDTRITALGRGWGGATRKKCPKKIKVSKYSMLYLEARAVRDKVE